ncbi:MAG: hypothetical protein ACXWW5_02245 [Actinomycetota bacterium]
MDEFGPVQILVVGFKDPDFKGEILAELQRLKELDIIRLVDMVAVYKDADGEIAALEVSDLSPDESAQFGAIAGALIGLGADGEEGAEAGALAGAEAAIGSEGEFLGDEVTWSIADTIPAGTAAAVALIEHRWAIGLRDAIRGAGGFPLADTWIHPEDLVAVGALMGGAADEEADS